MLNGPPDPTLSADEPMYCSAAVRIGLAALTRCVYVCVFRVASVSQPTAVVCARGRQCGPVRRRHQCAPRSRRGAACGARCAHTPCTYVHQARALAPALALARALQVYTPYGLAKLLEAHLNGDLYPAVRQELTSALDGGRPASSGADEALVRSTVTAARLLLRCKKLPADLATLAQQTVRYATPCRHSWTGGSSECVVSAGVRPQANGRCPDQDVGGERDRDDHASSDAAQRGGAARAAAGLEARGAQRQRRRRPRAVPRRAARAAPGITGQWIGAGWGGGLGGLCTLHAWYGARTGLLR